MARDIGDRPRLSNPRQGIASERRLDRDMSHGELAHRVDAAAAHRRRDRQGRGDEPAGLAEPKLPAVIEHCAQSDPIAVIVAAACRPRIDDNAQQPVEQRRRMYEEELAGQAQAQLAGDVRSQRIAPTLDLEALVVLVGGQVHGGNLCGRH
ncbi:MAG: hypothetical protein FJX57_16365 [Alphaproteobacteria bacterium]|nr:hypothetical protein [Alphaproteobacteria bacterium]